MKAACITSRWVAFRARMRSSVVLGSLRGGLKQMFVRASSTMPKKRYLLPTTAKANCGEGGLREGGLGQMAGAAHSGRSHACKRHDTNSSRTCPMRLTSSQIRHTSRRCSGTPNSSSSLPKRLHSLTSFPVETCRIDGGAC